MVINGQKGALFFSLSQFRERERASLFPVIFPASSLSFFELCSLDSSVDAYRSSAPLAALLAGTLAGWLIDRQSKIRV